jgi:hypothetical protein
MSKDQFEQRLIKAIDEGSNLSAADLAPLVDETESAIITAEADAKLAAEVAYDPTRSPDPIAARSEMENAHLRVGRLRTLLPRLRSRLQGAIDRDARARWQKDYGRAKPEKDALAEEFREFYPKFAGKLVDLLERIAACDAELSRLNQSRPAGANGAHLYGVELTARELGGFNRDTPSIIKQLQLPDWSNSAKLLYPPPRPSPAAAYAATLAPAYDDHRGADWWKTVGARHEARRTESQRVAKFYEAQEQQREDRANAEAEARAVPK